MISQVISEYDKDLKSKHAGQRLRSWPILGLPQNYPSKIIQTVVKIMIWLTVCMIYVLQIPKSDVCVDKIQALAPVPPSI
jgi:hypothetical protein